MQQIQGPGAAFEKSGGRITNTPLDFFLEDPQVFLEEIKIKIIDNIFGY